MGRGRVLVVDDCEARASMVSLALSSAGYATTIAGSQEVALACLGCEPPRAVVLAWTLACCPGIELLRHIKSGTQAQMPVIIVNSRDVRGDRLLAFEAGADDYVDRPLVCQELVARLNALVRRLDPVGPDPSRGQRRTAAA